ncbi:ATP synthase F1 subunit delta [Abyssicoccus albus]|uniref:ATP synthase subunit delta n=1 Tax=Abyssicoccus albus TaxID=1817405 RepID=A0A3N5BI53_9BACL|nr:ATP synthase F1 subunit delta [Abyssicoccus albus]RPF56439.1 ATP synthase F1 subcomplex delta subunit [Abyssicoccus albus]
MSIQSAKSYAQSLFDTALKHDKEKKVLKDLLAIHDSVNAQKKSYLNVVNHPKLSKDARMDMISKSFGEANKYVVNTIKVMASNNKLDLLPYLYEAYEEVYNEHLGIRKATVESTYKLFETELERIGQVFVQKLGLNKLIMKNEVNPSLIGGVRIKIDTKVYDGSIKTKLNDIKQRVVRH